MSYNYNEYFQKIFDAVTAFRDSENFPNLEEKNKDVLEMCLFTEAEYLSWIAFDYNQDGMIWYSRSLTARKSPEQAKKTLESYAGLETELTSIMQKLHGDERFSEYLKGDLFPLYALVVSVRISQELWKGHLSRQERREFRQREILDHVYASMGTQFINNEKSYDFEMSGDKIMDTAMYLTHFFIGEFYGYVQEQYAKMQH